MGTGASARQARTTHRRNGRPRCRSAIPVRAGQVGDDAARHGTADPAERSRIDPAGVILAENPADDRGVVHDPPGLLSPVAAHPSPACSPSASPACSPSERTRPDLIQAAGTLPGLTWPGRAVALLPRMSRRVMPGRGMRGPARPRSGLVCRIRRALQALADQAPAQHPVQGPGDFLGQVGTAPRTRQARVSRAGVSQARVSRARTARARAARARAQARPAHRRRAPRPPARGSPARRKPAAARSRRSPGTRPHPTA